jgi:prepilin-type N-terminal cleavage/methylation domain-containing protein
MQSRKRCAQSGLTLLELMLAVAVFTIVVGVTAQSLVGYTVGMDMQTQRNVALHLAQACLNDIRAWRDANPANFPQVVTNRWPNNGQVALNTGLRNGRVTVGYVNPASNPLDVTVTVRWTDLRGHPLAVSLSTVLTDR